MEKRVIIIISMMLMLALLLAGCGGSSTSNPSNPGGSVTGFCAVPMKLVPGAPSFPTGLDDKGTCTTVNYAYWMAETDVTYEQWCMVYNWAIANGYQFQNQGRKGNDGAANKTDRHPVTMISWRDTIVWCNALTEYNNAHGGTNLDCVYKYSGGVIKNSTDANATACDNATADLNSKGFRLPTSMEWELAARYKDRSNWTPGNYASGATAPYTDVSATSAVAWYNVNSNVPDPLNYSTQPVQLKPANAAGLYDMSGNVWQWCFDIAYSDADYRVTRGGCNDYGASMLQVGWVAGDDRSYCRTNIGFRPARTHFN